MHSNDQDSLNTLVLIPPDESPSPVPGISTVRPDRLISPVARTIDMCAIVIPFAVFIAAVVLLWGHGVNWMQLGLMIGMYLFTGFGVTVGFHRLFAHKAFETQPAVRATLAILGSMSVQGPLLWWVALHRRHHHYSDADGDPHSPHLHDGGVLNVIAGAWHSHVGWLFKSDEPGATRYVGDLLKQRSLAAISRLYPLWAALSLLIPAVVGGLITRTWAGALWGLVWGGLARVFLVHHITWSVNSVCHLWGSQPFDSHDHSRNNALFGLLALGEGWHNNHHAFPTSARHGLRWWEIDVTYWVIQCMAVIGLARRVKVPAARIMEERRARETRIKSE
jgi:stearoyl-CoA desaturase (Delta-9 desaturase)